MYFSINRQYYLRDTAAYLCMLCVCVCVCVRAGVCVCVYIYKKKCYRGQEYQRNIFDIADMVLYVRKILTFLLRLHTLYVYTVLEDETKYQEAKTVLISQYTYRYFFHTLVKSLIHSHIYFYLQSRYKIFT